MSEGQAYLTLMLTLILLLVTINAFNDTDFL